MDLSVVCVDKMVKKPVDKKLRDIFKREYVFAKEEERLMNEGFGNWKSVVGEDPPNIRAKRLREQLKKEFGVNVDKFDKNLGFS